MCIIIAKDKIGRLPTEKELKNSFEYNSDGAGFMYVDNGKVVIDKGYMTYESFLKHYKSLLKQFNNFKNKSLVMHFRIGTSGKNTKGNTHPYPITDNVKRLRTKHLSREPIGIAHNGIIKGYGTATGLNDTQEYISKYLYPLYFHYRDFYKNKDMLYQIGMATGSKFAILDKTDTIYYVGEFIDDKGLNFSNDTYKMSYTSLYSKYYGSNYYTDWYDELYSKQKALDEEEKEIESYYESLMPLERNWYVDLYGNGNAKLVGNKDYWYDYDTLELYELNDDDFELVASNPIIYDENYEELFY